jgi:monoamine oxidase
VTVQYEAFGRPKKIEGDFLVSCVSLVVLRNIPATPDRPDGKKYAIQNFPYYTASRPIFQARTAFWKQDGISPNMEFGDPALQHVWPMADEVPTSRGLLVGTAQPVTSAREALNAYRKYYPGKSENIEQVLVVDWSRDPWAVACEPVSYRPGELSRFWPAAIEPHGRIHFAGAYADNLGWGMEAATRSANRVAKAIDEA